MSGKASIKAAILRLILFALALSFPLICRAAGQTPDSLRLAVHSPQPLTTDPAAEISPALSPSQEYLVYASRFSGNYDIWVRPMQGGIAIPLTDHPADDHSPQWSRNGKIIVFVSHRDDVEGDIFALYIDESRRHLRASKIVPLVNDPGAQRFPSLSRDGRYLVYQEGGAPRARLILLELRRGVRTILTEAGYMQPRFSPVDDRILCLRFAESDSAGAICILDPGDLKYPTAKIQVVYDGAFPSASPAWSPDGQSFVAALTNHDSDGDGTLSSSDRAQLYRFDPVQDGFQYRLLLPGDSRENYPFWGADDFIYFASDRRGNIDLYRLPAEGIIPRAPSAAAGYEFALAIGRELEPAGRSLRRDESQIKLFALERVRLDFPTDRAIAAKTLLESARLAVELGAEDEAMAFFRKLARGYPEQTETVAQGLMDYHLLAHRAVTDARGEIAAENPSSLIANLEEVERQYAGQPAAVARSRWLRGWIWSALGDTAKAGEMFDSILSDFPDLGDWPTRALLGRAGLLEGNGNWAGALQVYHEILHRFPEDMTSVQQAAQRILDLRTTGDSALVRLRELSEDLDTPALAAAAAIRLAELHAQSGDTIRAIAEYNRLRDIANQDSTTYVQTSFAEGWIAAATLEEQTNNSEAALRRLAAVEATCSDLQNGYYSRQAHHLRADLLARRAQTAKDRAAHEAAMLLFQRALDLDPRNVRLHRGYIASSFSAGQIHRALEDYRQLKSAQPNDPVSLYSLGLCLSYLGSHNRRFLAQSNALLEAAISQQPDFAYGYLTLGYNYGLMERLTGPKGREQKWMERAIAVLQLGLAVNDDSQDPQLEGQLWLNLANSYYELGEYGYARALQAYRQRANCDTTFTSDAQAALTFEKMGRAAAMTGDNALAETSFQQSFEHWGRAAQPKAQLRLLLRLAELQQASGHFESSNDFYQQAAALTQSKGLEADSALWLTSRAYNALQLDQADEAAACAAGALELLGSKQAAAEDSFRNPLALEVFGATIPIWNFGFLGAGSRASAQGFTAAENKQLALSLLQEAQERQDDLTAARRTAYLRLASALDQHEREREARLWSEIGALNWQLGDPILARRSFLRSLIVCREEGLKAGRLRALIDLASIELEHSQIGVPLPEVQQDEIAHFSRSGAGLTPAEWQEISATIAPLNPASSPSAISRQLRGSYTVGFDPERLPPEPLNWKLIDFLLLLRDDPPPDAVHLRRMIRSEIDALHEERIGFDLERFRLSSLYAGLCEKEALIISDTTLTQAIERLNLESEALWALQSGIDEASRRGQTDQEIQLRLALADLLLRMDDPAGSAAELVASKNLAERLSNRLIWRIYWRLARASRLIEKETPGINTEAFDLVSSRLPEEWLELAEEAWLESLSEDNRATGGLQNSTEVRFMLELFSELALSHGSSAELFSAAQKLAAWSFWQNLPRASAPGQRMVATLALPVDTLQTTLHRGDLLLQIIEIGGNTELVLLKPNGLQHFSIGSADHAILQLDSLRRQFESGSLTWKEASREVLAALFAPIQNELDQSDRVFLVAPPRWDNIPLEWLLTKSDSTAPDLSIFRLPMPQSLLLTGQEVDKRPTAPVSFGLESPLPRVLQAGMGSAAESRRRLVEASIVLIRTQERSSTNALRTRLFDDQEKSWLAEDLMHLDRSGGALLLQGDFKAEGQIAQAALQGGFSCVLFLPAELPDDALQTLMDSIQRLSSVYPWPQACWEALQALRQNTTHSRFLWEARCYARIAPSSTHQIGDLWKQLHHDEAILEYSMPERAQAEAVRLSLNIITSNTRSLIELDANRKAIEFIVQEWRTAFSQRLPIDPVSRSLYDLLILPALPYLEGISNLVIIPGDVLFPISFAALKSPLGGYLLDQFAISYSLSLSEFMICRQLASLKPSGQGGLVTVLSSAQPSPDLSWLLFADAEARAIAATVPKSIVLLGGGATEAALRQHAQAASVLHLACHAGFPENDDAHALFLDSRDRQDGTIDGNDIANLNLENCRLAVLSSCGDGQVGPPRGDSRASIREAFQAAGSPRVISASSEVDDLMCAVLFKHFYRHLEAGRTPAQALRLAQLRVRDRSKPHPADWAAFRLWGEPR